MKIAHRYLLRDFIAQFALCAGAISIFMIGFVLYQEAATLVNYRVPAKMVVWLLVDRWPLVLLDVMPGAGLFAVVLSLGQMFREREIQVFRLSGWSFPRIVWPLLALTLILSYGLFLWDDRVVPISESHYAKVWAKITRERTYDFVVTHTFIAGPDNTHFYIGSIDRRTGEMQDILVYQETANGFPRFIAAKSGRMDGQVWTLRQGVDHEIGRDGYVTTEWGFEQMTVNAKQDWSFITASQPGMSEMNRAQLRAKALEYQRLSRPSFGFVPANGYWLEYHLKLATPFALFVFTTLAIPFACLGSRAGRLAIFLPGLLLYLLYFLFMTIAYALGSQGAIEPWLAAWSSDIFFGILAVALLLILVK